MHIIIYEHKTDVFTIIKAIMTFLYLTDSNLSGGGGVPVADVPTVQLYVGRPVPPLSRFQTTQKMLK